MRLIPAHAGKTPRSTSVTPSTAAHPRSRGENSRLSRASRWSWGSSPLTRGKQSFQVVIIFPSGLIPAHAGKTPCLRQRGRAGRAHPRSRGENRLVVCRTQWLGGSSPLTRGKRWRLPCELRGWWLIPAHAGKTYLQAPGVSGSRAHPRSRGENQMPSSHRR
mgnify:CR=1 FL=1